MPTMLMESKLLEKSEWGCHYLARWWSGEQPFWSCWLYTEADLVQIVLDAKLREGVVTMTALPSAGFYFVRQLRVRSPNVAVEWRGTKKTG
jgi:hypothetical protein